MKNASRAGLFLDLDGTVADSIDAMQWAYGEFLRGYGCVPSKREFNELNGPPLPEIVLFLKNRHHLGPSLGALLTHYGRLILKVYAAVPVRAGAARLIATAKSNGFKVAIVTSNSRVLANRWIRGNALQVDIVVGREDAVRGKPNPDLYLRALKETGCDAGASVAVEDSEQGLRAALGAGIRTCFFCGRSTAGLQNGVEAVNHLDSISEKIKNG